MNKQHLDKSLPWTIIQAPMLGVTTPEMVKESCKMGVLGSLPIGGFSPEKSLEVIRETKRLLNNANLKSTFAVNLFTHKIITENITKERYLKTRDAINKIAKENGHFSIDNNLKSSDVSDQRYFNYHDQIDLLLQENIKIISFTFGTLDIETIKKIRSHDHEIVLIGTATCLEEVKILESLDVNAIVLQGIESGGHRGSFGDFSLQSLPQVSLNDLLDQALKSNCKIPLIASGGIYSKDMIQYYLNKGASAVQIGTLFIPSHESNAIESYKDAIVNAPINDENISKKITLTRSYSGRWARGIENEFMKKMNEYETIDHNLILPYPILNYLTQSIRSESQKSNNNQFTNMWAGFNASKSKKDSMSNIIKSLI